MCYDRLVNGDVTEQRVPSLLRAELFCAVRNGALAGVIVLVVLLVRGVPAWLVAGSVLGAVALGTVLHQTVLLTGTAVLRLRDRVGPAAATDT
ncbi:hypothetical protein [Haloarcula litorea]|uniref:hypothetical protein n=1 Tax=Haloarcula litorea TaxID=3032579 RepID=UPI0023E7E316|nr:hypothetical protein [Halomicroarcula sp. GDY20]